MLLLLFFFFQYATFKRAEVLLRENNVFQNLRWKEARLFRQTFRVTK